MTPDRLHLLLQHAEWASNFNDRSLQRAADYVQRQRVIALQFTPGEDLDDDDASTLDGIVRGSEKQPYRCRVELQVHDQWLTLDTDCSCPVGVDCKHAAAMLLLAANLPPQSWPGSRVAAKPARAATPDAPRMPAVAAATPRFMHALAASSQQGVVPSLPRERGGTGPTHVHVMQSWMHWLQRLDSLRTTITPVASAERQFGILLRAADSTGQLLVAPAWLRPGKTRHGALVEPRALLLSDRDGPVPAPAAGWPAQVAGALAVLLHGQPLRQAGLPWTAIHAAHQEHALETLLAHYPAYFEKGSVPLQRAQTLPLQLRWRSLPDGSQQLAAEVDAAGPAVLLRGAGLWYVVPTQQVYGRIDGDPRLLDGIASAPLALPEQIDALSRQLQQRKTALPIPPPEPRGPVRVVAVAPVPVLYMHSVELAIPSARGQRNPPAFGCARLAYDYAGHLLPPDPDGPYARPARPVRILHEGQVMEIARDPEAEAEAEVRLENLGMVEAGIYAWEQGIRRHRLDDNDFLLQPQERKPPLTAEAWRPVLDQLADAGFRIEYARDFPHGTLVEIDDWHAELQPSGNQWFDVSLGVDVGGERIDLLPVLRRLLADPAFPRWPAKGERKDAGWRVLLDDTRSAELPLARLRLLIEPLLEWLEGDGELRLHRSQAPTLAALDEHLHWRGGELLRTHLQILQHAQRSADAPDGFLATLRPYQREGLAWLDFLAATGLGGILADDMGLGKTVQVLAHILGEKQRGRLQQPALVVAPTSLVGNWRDEAARFAPALKVLVIHGADRADRYDEIAAHDLIITTYPLLPRDREQLLDQRFALLVLDEAQAIKNANSQAARVVREIPAARRLAMTGTPLENHLGELWAQFDAVEPGLLGSQRQFTKLYRTPIEKHADTDRQQRLNRRIGPLLLRRRKDDVLTDLPAKTEILRMLELESDQRALYETLRLAQHERVQQAVRERGLAQSGIIVLDALLKLRQACCDPRLVKLASAKKIAASAKLDALLDLLDGLLGEGRRVLLFSQFTEMLALIETALEQRRIAYQILTGQTPARERSALVKRFQQGDVPVFLISLKAGGVGLNLTAADTVIHYDPWWNPAVEAQATDRAHRIGQDKPVFVYRLICAGTVEEKIQAMQGRKAELARAVLEGGGATQQLRFNESDLAELFAPL
ncbi:MAG: DEAD/DEAH box helicase [Rhodanobacter sp.]|nr:MAG: DEAD/DEAH box helicase [Rhodanobacter sp.]